MTDWTTMKPIGTKILVRLHGRRAKIGSIHIPECFARQPESGDVIAAGSRAPRELQAGVKVLVGKFNGVQIPAPAHDPEGEYFVMESDHSKPVPHCPDVYGVLDVDAGDDEVTAMVSSDAPRRR